MPAFIDETGNQYDKWSVLRRGKRPGSKRKTRRGGPGVYWWCLCDPKRGGCGRRKNVNGAFLRNRLSKGMRMP